MYMMSQVIRSLETEKVGVISDCWSEKSKHWVKHVYGHDNFFLLYTDMGMGTAIYWLSIIVWTQYFRSCLTLNELMKEKYNCTKWKN